MIKKKNIDSFLRRVKRFGIWLPLTGLVLTYLGKYIPYSLRRKIAQRRDNRIEREILSIVGSLPDIKNFEFEDINVVYEDIIWVMWLQGETQMPSVPRICFESLKRNCNQHKIVLITKDNLSDYVDIDKHILDLYDEGVITPAHLSDIIRMKLLGRYGGFWIDATMYLVRPLTDEAFKLPIYTNHTINLGGFFVSDYRWSGFYLSVRRECPIGRLASWIFDEYWRKENCLIDYFMIDYVIDILYNRYPEIQKDIDNVPFNNPAIHNLSNLLNTPFDEEEYERLTTNTDSFKLNWKAYSDDELEVSEGTFYAYLKRNAEI